MCGLLIYTDEAVGKTALTIRFVQYHFCEEYEPTIEDSYEKIMAMDGTPCCFRIVDTGGIMQYAATRDHYIRNAKGFMCVFAVDDPKSFENIEIYKQQIHRPKKNVKVPIMSKLPLHCFLLLNHTDIHLTVVASKMDMLFHRVNAIKQNYMASIITCCIEKRQQKLVVV